MPVSTITKALPTAGSLPVSDDVTGSLNGMTPKAVLVEATRCITVGTNRAGLQFARGAWDGTNIRSAVCFSGDNESVGTAHNTGHRLSTTKLLQLLDANATTLDAEIEPTTFIANGIRISVTNLPATAIQVKYTFFYGDDWEAQVGSYVGSTTKDVAVPITGLPFRPRGVIFWGARDTTGSGAGVEGIFMLGQAALNEDGSVQGQNGYTYFGKDTPLTVTCVGSGIRNDSVLQRITVDGTTGAVTEECRHEVTLGTAGGFEVTTRVNGGFAMTGLYLALRSTTTRTWCGVPTLGMTTTGAKTVTPGFPPGSIFGIPTMLDTLNAYSASHAGFGTGDNHLDGTQKCMAASDEDAAVTSDSYSIAANNFVGLDVANNADWIAAVSARSATTFTFNVTNSATLDVLTAFLVFEQVPLVSGDSERISDAHVARISQASGDTERIGDAHAVKAAQASADTERISDAHVAKIAQASADTERIADSPAFKAAQASGDTERISDSPAFKAAQASGDTERISDGHVFVVFAAAFFTSSDTEDIADAFVMVVSATSNAVLVSDDTLDIFESSDLVAHATLVVNDTENISDAALLYIGRLIISADTITITDGFGGTHITLRRSIQRARIEAGGAEIGIVIGPHSARGVVDG